MSGSPEALTPEQLSPQEFYQRTMEETRLGSDPGMVALAFNQDADAAYKFLIGFAESEKAKPENQDMAMGDIIRGGMYRIRSASDELAHKNLDDIVINDPENGPRSAVNVISELTDASEDLLRRNGGTALNHLRGVWADVWQVTQDQIAWTDRMAALGIAEPFPLPAHPQAVA